jgi:hypothetical protein
MGAVTHLTALISLDLSRNELSVDDGARICGAAAAGGMTQLQVLELEGNGFIASSVVGSDAWRQAGLQQPPDDFVALVGDKHFSVLLQYAVSGNCAAFAARYHPLLPVALLRRIESSDPSLTSLEIKGSFFFSSIFHHSSTFIGPSRVLGLAEALSLNTCITSLNLAGNKLGAVGLRTVIGAVTHLTALTSLDLSSNDMLPDGAEHLAVVVTCLTALTSLNLASNKLGAVGLRAVMGAVTHLMALTSLDLGWNELSVDDGARICGAAAAGGMTQLKVLELGLNGFSASSVVGSDVWKELGLPRPPDEILRQSSYVLLVQYLVSEDKAACRSIRIFVVGETTVSAPLIMTIYSIYRFLFECLQIFS